MARDAQFLKWAGSKRASAEAILAVLPERIDWYYEPFLGGGAVYFALRAAGRISGTAFLSDINPDLIAAYQAVQTDVDSVIRELKKLPYDKAVYLDWRALDPSKLDATTRGVRMIYLNRVGFNGLYRVNQKGKFNVPFGRYTNPTICDEPKLRAASDALAGAVIQCGDYWSELKKTIFGHPTIDTTVYFDPPYVPVSKTASFTGYASSGFGPNDQFTLAQRFALLADRKIAVALSNSDTPYTRELYQRFTIQSLQVRRSINSDGAQRGKVGELLVTGQK